MDTVVVSIPEPIQVIPDQRGHIYWIVERCRLIAAREMRPVVFELHGTRGVVMPSDRTEVVRADWEQDRAAMRNATR